MSSAGLTRAEHAASCLWAESILSAGARNVKGKIHKTYKTYIIAAAKTLTQELTAVDYTAA